MCYSPNFVATYNTILESGDIENNPGPGFDRQSCKKRNATTKKSTSKKALFTKCPICNKGVGNNRKRLSCIYCLELTHVTCSNLTTEKKNKITSATPTIGHVLVVYLTNYRLKTVAQLLKPPNHSSQRTYTNSTKYLNSFSILYPS